MTSNKTSKTYQPGELIFLMGDEGDCAYIIERGRIEIFVQDDDQRTPISVLGVGEIVGEMAIIDGSPRSASACAIEETELIIVSRDQLSERIDTADPVVRLLISILLKRMRQTNQKAAQTIVQKNNAPAPEADREPENKSNSCPSDYSEKDGVIEKIRFEAKLLDALKSNSFTLFFQPIVDLQNQRIAGFEALIRWISPTGTMVRPDIFMGVAEETSLIVPIGKWVLHQACRDLATFQAELDKAIGGNEKIFMSVNISGRQFGDANFFDELESATQLAGVEPKHVKLEITERVLLEGATVFHWIQRCRDMGFPIALDDFGTGYSSLSYLDRFNADNIKIDQSFISNIVENERTAVIVKSIIDMSHGLNIPVIAEGIESANELAILKKANCRFGQGYFFAKPMPAQEALELLVSQAKANAA